MKNNVKRIISLVLCLLMTAGLCTGLSSCVAGESANKLFEKAIGRTIDSMESYDFIKTLLNIGNGGSVETDISYPDEDHTVGGSIKLYSDSKNNRMYFDIDGEFDEIDLDAGIYLSDDKLIVDSSEILGGAYGLNISKYAEQLRKSVLYPDSGSKYALSDSDYEFVLDLLEKIDGNQKITDDGEKLASKYIEKFYTAFEKKIKITKGSGNTDVLEYDAVKATVLSFSVTDTELVACIADVWEDAKTDKKLKKWITENIIESESAQLYKELLSFLDDVSEEIDIRTGESDGDTEKIYGETFASADELYEKIDSYIAKLTEKTGNSSAELAVYLNPSSGAVMRADITLDISGDKTKYSVELGYKFKTFEGFRISRRTSDGDEWNKADTVYLKVISDTKEELKLQLLAGNTVNFPEITFKYNRTDGNITINYSGNSDIVIKMTVEAKKGEYKLELTSVSVNGVKTSLPVNVSLTLKEEDSMPDLPEYKNLADITDDEIDEATENIQDTYEKIARKIRQIFIGNAIDSVFDSFFSW